MQLLLDEAQVKIKYNKSNISIKPVLRMSDKFNNLVHRSITAQYNK